MAMIFGRFSLMADDLREALLEISHIPRPGHDDDFESRIYLAAEQIYREAACIEPDAHFSTLERAVRELALEASEAGLLDANGGLRASYRMSSFGSVVHPKRADDSGGMVRKRPVIFLSDGISYIDRRKGSAKVKRARER